MERFPKKFAVVRYEDFVENLEISPKQLFEFLNLPFEKETQEFLDKHTKHKGNTEHEEYSTFRNSSEIPLHWLKELSYQEIDEIQKVCTQAMQLYGYELVENEEQMVGEFDSVYQGLSTLGETLVTSFQ